MHCGRKVTLFILIVPAYLLTINLSMSVSESVDRLGTFITVAESNANERSEIFALVLLAPVHCDWLGRMSRMKSICKDDRFMSGYKQESLVHF